MDQYNEGEDVDDDREFNNNENKDEKDISHEAASTGNGAENTATVDNNGTRQLIENSAILEPSPIIKRPVIKENQSDAHGQQNEALISSTDYTSSSYSNPSRSTRDTVSQTSVIKYDVGTEAVVILPENSAQAQHTRQAEKDGTRPKVFLPRHVTERKNSNLDFTETTSKDELSHPTAQDKPRQYAIGEYIDDETIEELSDELLGSTTAQGGTRSREFLTRNNADEFSETTTDGSTDEEGTCQGPCSQRRKTFLQSMVQVIRVLFSYFRIKLPMQQDNFTPKIILQSKEKIFTGTGRPLNRNNSKTFFQEVRCVNTEKDISQAVSTETGAENTATVDYGTRQVTTENSVIEPSPIIKRPESFDENQSANEYFDDETIEELSDQVELLGSTRSRASLTSNNADEFLNISTDDDSYQGACSQRHILQRMRNALQIFTSFFRIPHPTMQENPTSRIIPHPTMQENPTSRIIPHPTMQENPTSRIIPHPTMQENSTSRIIPLSREIICADIGPLDMEVSMGTEEDFELHKLACPKRESHANYKEIRHFTIDDLPEIYRDNNFFGFIKMANDGAVRILTNTVSQYRKTSDPLSKYSGETFLRAGSGFVLGLGEKLPSTVNCPCPVCKDLRLTTKECLVYEVITTGQFIYDLIEAKNAVVQLSYYSNTDDEYVVGIMYGMYIRQSGKDSVVISCCTHDIQILEKLRDFFLRFEVNYHYMLSRYQSSPPLAVMISHPHGCEKQIAIFTQIRVIDRGDNIIPLWLRYRYDHPTCLGCCGAPIFVFGMSEVLLAVPCHQESGPDNCGISGRVEYRQVVEDEQDYDGPSGSHNSANEYDGSTGVCEGSTSVCEGSTSVCEGSTSVCESSTGVCEGSTGVCEGSTGVCEGSTGVCEGSTGGCEGSTGGCEGSTGGCEGSTGGCEGSTGGCEGSTGGCEGSTGGCEGSVSSVVFDKYISDESFDDSNYESLHDSNQVYLETLKKENSDDNAIARRNKQSEDRKEQKQAKERCVSVDILLPTKTLSTSPDESSDDSINHLVPFNKYEFQSEDNAIPREKKNNLKIEKNENN